MSALQDIIQSQLKRADGNPNEWVSTRLKNGMTIHTKSEGTEYILFLSRADVYPSPQEWQTVAKYWPYAIETPHFETGKKDSPTRFYLKGRVPKNKQETFA